ncbi:MAG: hypothetical protein QXQ38_02705 [Archaeoglobaceae archaeon]
MVKDDDLVKNVFLILIPAVACTLIYLSGLGDLLVLKYPSDIPRLILTSYTTNFVHRTFEHFIGNMGIYLFCSFTSFILLRMMNLKIFRKTLLAILLLVPFICSAVTILGFEISQFPDTREAYGFSGIGSATAGILVFSLALVAAFEKGSLLKDDIIWAYLMALFCVPYYFHTTYLGEKGYIFIILPIIPSIILVWRHRTEKRRLLAIFFAFISCVVSVGMISAILFPQTVVQNGQAVNIPAHLVGFVMGILISFLFVSKEI